MAFQIRSANRHNGSRPVAAQKDDRGLCEKVPAGPRAQGLKLGFRGTVRRYLLGTRPEPIPSYLGPVEEPVEGKTGICCSGGGIRSAAFNLGALQALQRKGELRKAHYLTAVSGGSYLAAAISMVAESWPKGRHERPKPGEPGHDDSDPGLLEECPPFAPGSREEQYLRNRSSYLAPSTSDKVYLAFRVTLGLLFNLIFLALPLFGAGVLLGRWFYRHQVSQLAGHCGSHCHANLQAWHWALPVGLIVLAAALTLGPMVLRVSKESRRQLYQTTSMRLLGLSLATAVVLVAIPELVGAFHQASASSAHSGAPTPHVGATGGAAGLAGLIAGALAYLRGAITEPKQAMKDIGRARKALSGLSVRLRQLLMYAAGAVIGPLLLFGALVWGASFGVARPAGFTTVAIGAGCVLGFLLLYSIADITSWSLHPFYKRRLASAFALKRVRASDLTPEERRRVRPTPPVAEGQDPPVALERDFDRPTALSKFSLYGDDWPTLVVCAAANVSDSAATPPGREVTSFTFSRTSIGGPLTGGALTDRFESAFDEDNPTLAMRMLGAVRRACGLPSPHRNRDFSLMAAVAMSGAAISPSMGKMTRKPLRFLLALANIRLGVWVPNPCWVMTCAEDERLGRRLRTAFGRARPIYLLRELMGRNHVNGRYLYVSDGGHYENLGLVELLRRGCTRIYCFDASGGLACKELGDAIALARSELGVEIEIDPSDVVPDSETGRAKADTVVGTFTYTEHVGHPVKGTLVYARNVLTDKAPYDVAAYHEVDPAFPHNPTSDQLYTDQKFEGYRALGELAGANAVKKMRRRARTAAPRQAVTA